MNNKYAKVISSKLTVIYLNHNFDKYNDPKKLANGYKKIQPKIQYYLESLHMGHKNKFGL